MFNYIKGDLLNSDADIICHQVNLQGYMGGGLALSIAKKYPSVESAYRKYRPKELGEVCFAKTDDFVIANCFSQTEDFNTDYDSLEQCLWGVKAYMTEHNLKKIAIPHKYGCGIANGDWETVLSIFGYVFNDIDIYIKE